MGENIHSLTQTIVRNDASVPFSGNGRFLNGDVEMNMIVVPGNLMSMGGIDQEALAKGMTEMATKGVTLDKDHENDDEEMNSILSPVRPKGR